MVKFKLAIMNDIKVFYPNSLAAWRDWLENNHLVVNAIWVVFYSKKSKIETITWSDAVDVALCFGWIDSKKMKIDEHCSHQFFSKRKAKSTWSKINKEKIKKLIAAQLMVQAGYESIAIAKKNGSWTMLDEVETLIIPEDLEAVLAQYEGAKVAFLNLSKSVKRLMLSKLLFAKKTETRNKRIAEIIAQVDASRKIQ